MAGNDRRTIQQHCIDYIYCNNEYCNGNKSCGTALVIAGSKKVLKYRRLYYKTFTAVIYEFSGAPL